MRGGDMANSMRTFGKNAVFPALLVFLAFLFIVPAASAEANNSTADNSSVNLDNAIWNFSSGNSSYAENNLTTSNAANANATNANETNPAPASNLTNASAGQNQGGPANNSSMQQNQTSGPAQQNSTSPQNQTMQQNSSSQNQSASPPAKDAAAKSQKRARSWLEYSHLKKVRAEATSAGGTSLAFLRPKNFDELQYAVAARPQAYNFGQGDFAVFMWIKADPETGGTLISKADYSEGRGWRLGMNVEGTLFFSINDASSSVEAETVRAFNDGAWHHVAAVRSGRTIRLYVDGEERMSATGGQVMDASSNGPLSVGADMSDYDWSGTPRYQFAGSIQHVELIAYAPGAADIGAFFAEGMK